MLKVFFMIELEEPSQVTMKLLQKFNNALRIEHISVKDKVRMNHFNWTKSTSLFKDLIHKWIDIDRMKINLIWKLIGDM